MSKKKLVQLLSKDCQLEDCLDTNYFQTEEGDQRTTKMVKLYDKCFVIFTNSGRVEPWGRVNFDYDLIFEVIKDTEEEHSKRRNNLRGLKFQRGEEVCYLYSSSQSVMGYWREKLSARLNQRGFHQMFKPVKKIGKGNFASVYLAMRLEDDRKVAVKAFSKQAVYSEDKGKQSLINEIELMRKFNHKNLMRLFEVYQTDNSVYLIVELLEGGQLNDKIKSKCKFSHEQVHNCIKGLLLGLKHMHARRVMHRDLKPQNILMRKEGDFDCVIADFGLSAWADEPEYLFVRCGTPGYVAPEIVNLKNLKAKCDPICDIFSLGIIFHILLLGRSPFPGKTYNEVLAQNRNCAFNFEAEEYGKLSSSSMDLLKKMLSVDPKNRVNAEQALKHPFFGHQPLTLPSISHQHSSYGNVAHKKTASTLTPSIHVQNKGRQEFSNKTSILGKVSMSCDSPLMTSNNPIRKQAEPMLEDSCLTFKMKECVMTGKTEQYENSQNDSPALKKTTLPQPLAYKESKFGLTKKALAVRQSNAD